MPAWKQRENQGFAEFGGCRGQGSPPCSYKSCIQGTLVTGWESPGAEEACGREGLCVGLLGQLRFRHLLQMCFSRYPDPRRCHDLLLGYKTTEHCSAPSSHVSPVPIHAKHEQTRYQEPSSGKRRTMPETSQHNSVEMLIIFFLHVSGLQETQQN